MPRSTAEAPHVVILDIGDGYPNVMRALLRAERENSDVLMIDSDVAPAMVSDNLVPLLEPHVIASPFVDAPRIGGGTRRERRAQRAEDRRLAKRARRRS